MIPNLEARLQNAIAGWQGQIVGTLVAVSGTPKTSDVAGANGNGVGSHVALTGATLASGTYYFLIPAAGCAAVDVTLRASANATNIDTTNSKVYRVLSDWVTEKMGATGSSTAVTFGGAFANGTQQTASVTTLRGERGVLLKLVLTGSVTFDQAESSAL